MIDMVAAQLSGMHRSCEFEKGRSLLLTAAASPCSFAPPATTSIHSERLISSARGPSAPPPRTVLPILGEQGQDKSRSGVILAITGVNTPDHVIGVDGEVNR
jgi:hypothetical protein